MESLVKEGAKGDAGRCLVGRLREDIECLEEAVGGLCTGREYVAGGVTDEDVD